MTLRATVTDMLGRVVAQLHEGPIDAGTHELVWDGSDLGRKALKSGLYFLNADYEHGVQVRPFILLGSR